MNWKGMFTNWKVILLLLCILFALTAIHPLLGERGVQIKTILPNSSASDAGMVTPSPQQAPVIRERILSLNGEPISSEKDYHHWQSSLVANRTVAIETNERVYTLRTKLNGQGQDELHASDELNASDELDTLGEVDLGIRILEAPSSNLRKGLDLAGGTRVVLQPAEPLSADELELTLASMSERLNVFGLSDVVIRSARDFSGTDFIVVEIAGLTEDEVEDLLAKQGKFEAKIANSTVFLGGKQDITYVCRSAECSGIDLSGGGCAQAEGSHFCRFFFSITLSPEAAARQAEITNTLDFNREGSSCSLSEEMVLFLDDQEVDRLRISCELKGRSTTNIQISGSGVGRTEQEAVTVTLQNMKRLQTILITGSLPVTLHVVKTDTISPSLGKEFLNNVLLVGVLAIVSVSLVILLRYRKIKIVIPVIFVLLSEMIIILGFAALVGWNLDLAAIAGIIVTAGTAVDHLIIITDEVLRGERHGLDWKTRIKQAMVIVFGAYLTTASGMIPLWFAGAGLLKGFAFTTIVGLSFGVLIARPAYAVIVEKLLS